MYLIVKNLLLGAGSFLLVTSCAVKETFSTPDENKFVHIDGTPAYVLIESDKSLE